LGGLWAIFRGRGETRRRDLLVLLGLSGLGSLVVFCLVSGPAAPPATTRYLLPLLVTGAIAAGAILGSARFVRRQRQAWAAAAGIVFGVAYLVMPLRVALGRSPAWPVASAADWFRAHGLSYGVGTYWDASYLTLQSGGRVVVRPVAASGGRLGPYRYFADAGWFADPRFRHPSFLVFETATPWGGVNASSATETFGATQQSVLVGPYTVLIWRH
jgi:hypothetical protein